MYLTVLGGGRSLYDPAPRDSKEVICFLKSASLSLVRKRGGSLVRLSAHLSLFTDMDKWGTTAGSSRTVDEIISETRGTVTGGDAEGWTTLICLIASASRR